MEYECEICGIAVSSDMIDDETGLRYCPKHDDMMEQQSLAEQFQESEMIKNMTRDERMRF